MTSLASRIGRWCLMGVLPLAGCLSLQSPGVTAKNPAERFLGIQDSVAGVSANAPRIRVFLPTYSVAALGNVAASFRVSDDAYVMVVAVDLDRRVRVVYPESPDSSGFVARNGAHELPRFFAGFGSGGSFGLSSSSSSRLEYTQRVSRFGGSGVILAVASDRPLQLDRLLDADGEWNVDAVADLVFDASVPAAAHALARAVTLTGQDYSTDYTNFFGNGRGAATYASLASALGGCDGSMGHSRQSALSYGLIGLYVMNGVQFARYRHSAGVCGEPIYYDVPINIVPRPPAVPRDTTNTDSTTTPGRRFGPGRYPRLIDVATAESRDAAEPAVRFRAPERLDHGSEEPSAARPLRFRPTEPATREPARAEPRAPPRPEPARSAPVRSEPAQVRTPAAEPARQRNR